MHAPTRPVVVFVFIFINIKSIDNAEAQSEIKQTKMSANQEKRTETRTTGTPLNKQEQTRSEINCNDVIRDQATYSSTALK